MTEHLLTLVGLKKLLYACAGRDNASFPLKMWKKNREKLAINQASSCSKHEEVKDRVHVH